MSMIVRMTDAVRKSAELLAAVQAVTVLADDKFLTTQQTASLLKMSRQYIVRLIEDGHVPAMKVGSDWRLRRADVETFKVGRDTERAAALDALVALSEEIGGYDLSPALL